MKKVGFFGGTFDPIHFGHINLALQLMEIHQLDEIIICPATRSPFKGHLSPSASIRHRVAMAKLAIQDIAEFRLSSIEAEKPGISYTIDTLRVLSQQFDEKIKLYLLLSTDALASFHHWKDPEAIVALAAPLIGSRRDGLPQIPPSPVKKALQQGLTPTMQMEISSTQIRDRLKKGLYCGHLVNARVLNYIEKESLYG
jgi:nicotinate-nucleotide adenylyltransferase